MGETTLKLDKTLPLIMLHGLLGLPDNWDSIIPFLPKTCHPIVLHVPFFDEGTELTTIDSIITYIQKYIDEKKFGKIVLMGNSFGGHVGSLFAVRLPERVCGLVLTASGGLAERGFARPGTHPQREYVREKACEIFYDHSFVTDDMLDYIMDIVTNRKKGKKLLQLAKAAKRDNISESLKLIRCPTLLIWGKQDTVTPPKVAEEFNSYIPNSKLVWIDKCGHAPMMEHPEEFARHLSSWWNDTFVQS